MTASSEALFVTALYNGLLNREPDPDGLRTHVGMLRDGKIGRKELADLILESPEFAATHSSLRGSIDTPINAHSVFVGHSSADLDIFSQFDVASVAPSEGFVTDWIGSKVRISSLWDGCEHLDNIVHPRPVPCDYHSEAVEWIGTLKAVLAASGSISVMELGAGFGPWLSASAAAARARGIEELHLYGVEGDPGRFELLQLNMADNGLAGPDTVLLQGAIGVQGGRVRWPRIPDPRNDSGARPSRVRNADDVEYLGDRNDHEMINVEVFPLRSLLKRRPVWDLIHIDVQGTEHELCAGCIKDLSERARYLVIGTHSRKLDGDLMLLFSQAGWSLDHEKPARMPLAPGATLTSVTIGDGTQVWRNPRL